MKTRTLLLCAFILWMMPSYPDSPYFPINTYLTLAECQASSRSVDIEGKTYFYACFPDSFNPNQR